jgi:hypothetical protein
MTNYLYNNSSIPKSSEFFINDDDNNRCMKFTSNDEYFSSTIGYDDKRTLALFNKLLFIITVDNSSIYDYFEINFESFTKTFIDTRDNIDITKEKLLPKLYFITLGRYNIFTIYYKNKKHYSSYLSGFLGFDVDKDDMSIIIEHGVLAQIPNTFNTVLEIAFSDRDIVEENINLFKNSGN